MKKGTMLLVALMLMMIGCPVDAEELGVGWGGIDIHGFISQGFLKSEHNNFFADTEDGTFQFNEVGINFSTQLTDRLHAGLQLFSRDQGDIGNHEPEIDWAYADFRWRDWLGLRVGRIKESFGLYNDIRDVDMLRTFILLPQSIYNEVMRDSYFAAHGITVYGYLNMHQFGGLHYSLGINEDDMAASAAMVKFIENESFARVSRLDTQPGIGGMLDWETPCNGLRLKTSFCQFDLDMWFEIQPFTPWASDATPVGSVVLYQWKNANHLVFSAEYARENLTLAAEYYRMSVDVLMEDMFDLKETEEGYYASAAYRFTDWFELGLYYAEYYPNADDKEGREFATSGLPDFYGWQKDLTVTTRFDINEYWIIKLEGHIVDGAALFLSQDNPEAFEEDSLLFAVKTTFSF